ncbi:hypothetical protein Hanom_Chr12g01078751 [Helianthus anomalus]
MLFFSLKKKPIHLRGECRHQFRVLGEFKRGVDVAHEDWLGVREGTHLLGEHPLHPKSLDPCIHLYLVVLLNHFLMVNFIRN